MALRQALNLTGKQQLASCSTRVRAQALQRPHSLSTAVSQHHGSCMPARCYSSDNEHYYDMLVIRLDGLEERLNSKHERLADKIDRVRQPWIASHGHGAVHVWLMWFLGAVAGTVAGTGIGFNVASNAKRDK